MGRVTCAILSVILGAAAAPAADSRLTELAFEEPLVRTAPTAPAEDEALHRAIRTYQQQASSDDLGVFEQFLVSYPNTGWRVALLTDLGLSYYHYGYFSRAIESWEQAWKAGRSVRDPRAKALVDRAVGELARMHARLGHADRLEALFSEIGDRPITGAATELVQGAREGLWMMRNEWGTAYLCGPMALKNLLLARGATYQQVDFLNAVRSGAHGVSLDEVARLAEKAHLGYRLIFRDASQPVPVPSIVHWKVTHFAAIVEEADGRFHLKDPTFGQDLWVSRAALDAESSGYFLAPEDHLIAGWREVPSDEAGQVRGMGNTGMNELGATRDKDRKTFRKSKNGCRGMCDYNVQEMVVSLNLEDTPAGYVPPKGPPVYLTVDYNQREAGQPAIFSWFNFSPKWTFNWLSYLEDDPKNARANINRYLRGGGFAPNFFDTKSNGYQRDPRDASILVRTSTTPITYEVDYTDGSRDIYSVSNNAAAAPRRIFLSQVIDQVGNTVTLKYDGQFRLIAIVDAMGRITTLSYDSTSSPLLVTKVTDPFGRTAKFSYDVAGRLIQITDVLGLTSQMTYDSSNLVNSLTTPYGTSKFAYGQNGTTRFLEATDALGHTERVEFRHAAPGITGADPIAVLPKNVPSLQDAYTEFRNTFYWDKHNYPKYANDYTKARRFHWTHDVTNENSTYHVLESIVNPMENRIWFTYPGQPDTLFSGTLDNASRVARVLDDGTTQMAQVTYNTLGHPTDSIDPAGRETQYVYDPNQIDLLQVKQKTSAAAFTTVAEYTYNSHHQPLTAKDAAGQVTAYAYNTAGQLTQITNPLGQITTYEYDISGRLSRIVNPNNRTATSFTYDTLDHVATRTDSEGYTVSFTYDALDRIVRETYPDGTSRDFTWDKLDLVAVRDRQGRVTRYTYDAIRNLVDITDPIGGHTKLGYYENGRLKTLTDPNGNVTTFDIDLENRVTATHYADGTQKLITYENTTSRIKSITDALGQKKQFTYTIDDRIAAIDYSGAQNPTPKVSFTYDPYFQRAASMTDGTGTTKYTYQPIGSPGALQLQQETGPFPNATIAYQYDSLGRLMARTVDASTETFAYDTLSRLTSHTSDLGAFDLTYLGETGQPTARQLRDGSVATQWAYDDNTNDRRLQAIANNGAARSYQYTMTPESLISQIAESATVSTAWPVQTWSYTYDDMNRLQQGSSTTGDQYNYAYDNADNLMVEQGPSIAGGVSLNALNQIASFNGQGFVYDANGNLLSDGTRTYTWDAENRLLSIGYVAQPTWSTTFRYDGHGRRIAIVTTNDSGTTETRYLWCGDTICQARDATDTVTRRYYPEGELLPGSATPLYYAKDHLGSVRDIQAADGSNGASFDYDAYGNPIQSSGSAAPDVRYAKMFYEQTSGLYLTRYRAYDPQTGRWLSKDPLGNAGGTNLYAYVNGNPITNIDPLGLDACSCSKPNNFTQASISAGASFYAALGFDVNLGLGVSVPDSFFSDWHNWRDIQLFVTAQVNRGAGLGGFVGVGGSAAVSRASDPLPQYSTDQGTFAGGQGGAGPAVGVNLQMDQCGQLNSWGSPVGKAGFGFGAIQNYGVWNSVTAATPKFGDVADSFVWAWHGIRDFFSDAPALWDFFTPPPL
jgi:RHS repeat-associated protein